METEHFLRDSIRRALAPDDIWTLQNDMLSLYSESLRRLPKGAVCEQERRYPTTTAGLRAFMNGFFARHFFQIQDSLLDFFASPTFETIARRGVLYVADVGCGPAVATLAIANLASVFASMSKDRRFGPLTIHTVLNDTSEVCLVEGRRILEYYGRMNPNCVNIGRVITLPTPFPKSISQLRRVSGMTAPFDICCLGYVLIPLSEQLGIKGTGQAIGELARSADEQGGQLLLTQDKFRETLIRAICKRVGIPAEIVDLKQRVYDTCNQNEEQPYTYCRSCVPISKVVSPDTAGVSMA